ncbi:PR-1-like protein [Xylona heveae TC161]|uniref:PR-1-like protein n=1 Tax=Xylona heveae (strain CBS 132557 / TC161) TaxID=1328760 RepID=A0A165AKF4_XYLHT|nr:PR-1-like protein [Xylona heveae TC161]KZF20631.1 PR-1-like protein [Xylona heveae TC161]
MRYSALVSALFAAGALASPMAKRDAVTNVNVVVVTDTVTAPTETVTAHGEFFNAQQPHQTEASTSSAAPSSTQAASSSSSEAPSATVDAVSGSSPSDYASTVLYHHNVHRANHTVSDLQYNDTLADIASQIASSCVYAHNTQTGGGGYGQNIAAGVDASGIDKIISDMFYNGEINYFDGLYGQANPDMTNFEKWGHFSQIVWKDTTSVGCATHQCSSLANTGSNVPPYFTVCNYYPPGNYGGEYADNVQKPKGDQTVSV